MQRVSSVTAFLCRSLGDSDTEAQEILNALTGAERRAITLLVQVHDPNERLRRLSQETGEAWRSSRYERVVELAMNRLSRLLQQRQLLTP